MMLLVGIVGIVIGLGLFQMGYGSLRDGANHLEYGVETESLHRTFARLYIGAGCILCGGGTLLALKSAFG